MGTQILLCWLGMTDLKAASGVEEVGLGPVAQAVAVTPYKEVVLLNNWEKATAESYIIWLQRLTQSALSVKHIHLSSPTNFGEIYQAASAIISKKIKEHSPDADLVFHLSPGTPAMAAVWILLAKTRFPAELIESSKEHGVRTASVPFDISAEFLPDLLNKPDKAIVRLASGIPAEAPELTTSSTAAKYDAIFGPYLVSADKIDIKEPYLRYRYQLDNFQRFCELVARSGTTWQIMLITGDSEGDDKFESDGRLEDIKRHLQQYGIEMSWKRDQSLHAREIMTSDGWVILSDRGLDIYKKPESRNEFGHFDLALRRCKQTQIHIRRSL